MKKLKQKHQRALNIAINVFLGIISKPKKDHSLHKNHKANKKRHIIKKTFENHEAE